MVKYCHNGYASWSWSGANLHMTPKQHPTQKKHPNSSYLLVDLYCMHKAYKTGPNIREMEGNKTVVRERRTPIASTHIFIMTKQCDNNPWLQDSDHIRPRKLSNCRVSPTISPPASKHRPCRSKTWVSTKVKYLQPAARKWTRRCLGWNMRFNQRQKNNRLCLPAGRRKNPSQKPTADVFHFKGHVNDG